jgi:hypothetical protein
MRSLRRHPPAGIVGATAARAAGGPAGARGHPGPARGRDGPHGPREGPRGPEGGGRRDVRGPPRNGGYGRDTGYGQDGQSRASCSLRVNGSLATPVGYDRYPLPPAAPRTTVTFPSWIFSRFANQATHRLGRARAGSRRTRRLPIVARRAACDRHPQPLTAAGRRVTKKPRGGRTRRDSAPTREKRHFRGERRRSREPLSGPGQPRDAGATRSRAAHPSGNACGSAIDRAIFLSFHTRKEELS